MVGRPGCCSSGQSFNLLVCGLSKTLIKGLIHLSADSWGCVPSLLVVWLEATQHWSLPGLFGGANGGLWECSPQGVLPRTSAVSVLLPMVSHSPTTTTSAGDPPTLAGRSGSVSPGVSAHSPGSHTTLCVPSKS